MTTPPNMPQDPSAPYSLEAEEAVIGSVLIDPSVYITLTSFLRPEDFFLLRHNYIWQSFFRLSERGDAIDPLTVAEELENMGVLDQIGGRAYLMQVTMRVGTSVHAEVYGRLVERTALRRNLMDAADKIKDVAKDESINIDNVIGSVETTLFQVTEKQVKREFVPMWDAVSAYYDHIEQLLQNRDQPVGLPSGFRDLDTLLGGFQKSDLLIFAGRPGMGKCVIGDTLVHTANGTVRLDTLKPDSEGETDDVGGTYYPLKMDVLTANGIRQTSHFYDAGEHPTLKITTRAGYTLTGTWGHALKTLRGGIDTWVKLADLVMGDSIAVRENSDIVGAMQASPTNKQPKKSNIVGATMSPATLLTAKDILPDGFIWDEIVSIEDTGIQPCYDLVVPDEHTYVANGIVSHNTSWMLTTAMNTARFGARVAIFTMEMGVDQLVQRLVAMETGINVQKLRLGQLNQQEVARFTEAVGRISSFNIFIDDTPAMSPMEMRTKCRRLKHEYGLDLLVVDYMQLMNAGGNYENNRVQEISYISRALKELARELNVPLISAAQLSRAVEQRQDKRPVLSDLRESGCITGDSPVYLPDCGYSVPIRDLVGKTGFRVMSINTETWKAEPATVTNAFCTGTKPVYKLTTALGRTIRATGNHKFLTVDGWTRLDELTTDSHIAVPRNLPDQQTQTMSDAELALLGHLIGDCCVLPRHAIQYTTVEPDLAQLVADLATEVFGDELAPRIHKEEGRNWYQVFLPTTRQITHGVRNRISEWLEDMGIFGLRSHEKRIPDKVFSQPNEQIALFLRHLWATDGCLKMKPVTNGYYPNIYYATSSPQFADDVQGLLLRLGINAAHRVIPQGKKGLDQHHINVAGKDDIERYVEVVKAVEQSAKNKDLEHIREYISDKNSSTKRDYIPYNFWNEYVIPKLETSAVNIHDIRKSTGMKRYSSKVLVTKNVSREAAQTVGEIMDYSRLKALGESDVYWDKIKSIEPDGIEEVFDLSVMPNNNFYANSLVISNSIEQDADIVMFLYRDEVYNEATEFPNQADVIIAKHRNGPTGTISLYFEKSLTKFMDASVHRVDLSDLE